MKSFLTFIIALFLINNAYSQDDWIWTKGPLSGVISSLAVNKSGYVFCSTNQGVYRSTDKGNTWTLNNNGLDILKVTCMTINPVNQNIFVGTDGGGVYMSNDDGNNWEPINYDSLSYFKTIASINCSVDGHVICGTYMIPVDNYRDVASLFLSTNNGKNWKLIHQRGSYIRHYVNYDAVTFSPFGQIYFSIYKKDYNDGDNSIFLYSSDDGKTINDITKGLVTDRFNNIIINPDRDILITTEISGAFRSQNNGASWEPINNNLFNKNIRAFVLANDGQLFTGGVSGGTNGGVYRSTNNGDVWRKYSNGLKNLEIYALAIDSSGYIYAGTDGGVYKTIKSVVVGIDENTNNSNFVFSISPNPATDFITINLQPSESLNTSEGSVMEIFDMLGVRVISDEIQPMTSSQTMNIENLSPGMYIIKIGDRVEKFIKL